MADARPAVSYAFAFERPLDRWARLFAVLPTRSYVRVDDHGFEAVYGPWRVATTWSNVVGVERSGPYQAWKIAGPAHLSLADRGMTMAATTKGGVCLRFREPVPGLDPLGLLRHPGLTLGVDDPDAFVRDVEARRAAAIAESGSPPTHPEGRLLPALRAIWQWKRRPVRQHEHDVDPLDTPALDRAGDVDDQPVEIGTGPLFHRRYQTTVRACRLSPEEAMAAIQADPNVLADLQLAPFTKVRGTSGGMRAGDRFVIEITGPWKGAVEVIDVTPTSLRLATLEGHMESGVIEMRTSPAVGPDSSGVTLTIESWARSHDRFLDLMYDKLGIAKALQGEMWAIACDRFAQLVDGEQADEVEVLTERGDWSGAVSP